VDDENAIGRRGGRMISLFVHFQSTREGLCV
jgi:hypothetical protein